MNIVITGASRGIGKEFVLQYLNQNKENRVLAITQNPEKLKDLQNRFEGRLFTQALFSEGEILSDKNAASFSSVDLLINNAGIYPKDATFQNLKYSSIEEGIRVNVGVALTTTQACLSLLKKSKTPKAIFISSLMGSISDNSSGGSHAYRISKTALNMLVKGFSIEERNIISAVLHPGWVKTDMGGSSAPTSPEESVLGMIQVIQKLDQSKSGGYYDFEGDQISW